MKLKTTIFVHYIDNNEIKVKLFNTTKKAQHFAKTLHRDRFYFVTKRTQNHKNTYITTLPSFLKASWTIQDKWKFPKKINAKVDY